MKDACIGVTRARARCFEALHCLHIAFAKPLYLGHSFEQFIKP
jgi:hypothetical protein